MEIVFALVGLAAVACCLGLAAAAGIVGVKAADAIRDKDHARSDERT